MATALTTRSSTRHVVPGRALRRGGEGRLRPPNRRRPVGAAHAVVAPDCAPRRSPIPLAALVGVAASVAATVFGLGSYVGSMAESTVPGETAVVRVAPGESLSELAARSAPGSDVSAVVDRIMELNGLVGADLVPGQPLTVPVARG
ncbi:LysM peptidoglycan-binding domain-containing protein [Actinokineospora sp. 24-640]